MSTTIHFFIRTERPFQDKSAPLYLLLTINRKLKAKISLGKRITIKKDFDNLRVEDILKLSPELRADMYNWDERAERVERSDPNAKQINRFLDAEKKRANDIILKFELLGRPLTIESFKKDFCRNAGNLKFSEYFLNELESQSGRWSEETLRGLKSKIKKINKFRPGLTLNDVTFRFLNEYESYLLKPVKDGGLGNSPLTVASNMRVLRTLIRLAIKNGDFLKDNYPFEDYKISGADYELTTRDYLEPDEVVVLERLLDNYVPPDKPLIELRQEEWNKRSETGIITPGEYKTLKRFLGACYTGLRFRDTCILDRQLHVFSKNIEIPSGPRISRYYIEIKMHKTGSPVVIPLIERAVKIFEPEKKEGKVFEPLTNKTINEHLESIGKKAGITKHLTFHVARHTFATICFINDISEKIGQKLLGHKNRKFTEIYTHLSSHKLFLEMDKFNEGMDRLTRSTHQSSSTTEAEILQLVPDLKKLDSEKLEQIKGLLKILGKSA